MVCSLIKLRVLLRYGESGDFALSSGSMKIKEKMQE